ncbi:MAG TPA: class I SAM-dependent methyltransferase [Candidatus Paceibacterota bacterium]
MSEDKKAWQSIHAHYSKQDWVNKPSIFAEEAIQHFPKGARILEIGGGLGQDSIFFAQKGFDVTLTDRSVDALVAAKEKIANEAKDFKIKTAVLDASTAFPFKDGEFDVVYAHLSLHYFDTETTHKIFSEIARVLKPKGVLAALFNSVDDPEYGTGEKIEESYFLIQGVRKRFFSVDALTPFTKAFKPAIIDNKGETYKDRAKGISGLIRFIGNKI